FAKASSFDRGNCLFISSGLGKTPFIFIDIRHLEKTDFCFSNYIFFAQPCQQQAKNKANGNKITIKKVLVLQPGPWLYCPLQFLLVFRRFQSLH
ncbi:MAG: hypothetical protein IJV77_08085, partial [Clostridia bacterium]|nr:hypothetical protein [Clostridia bacterium]